MIQVEEVIRESDNPLITKLACGAIMRHNRAGRCAGMTIGMMRRALFASFIGLAALAPAPAQAAVGLDGAALRWPWALPFLGILVTIATGPLLFARFWHRHYGKLAFIWSVLTLAPLAAVYGTPAALAAFVHTG